MSPELRALCESAKLALDNTDSLLVEFENGRNHRVFFEEVSEETLRVWGVVAKRKTVESLPRLALAAWQRNRGARLVGFHIDSRERLIGSARLPRQGLQPEELKLYVRAVAAECDRFEFLLTGRDRY